MSLIRYLTLTLMLVCSPSFASAQDLEPAADPLASAATHLNAQIGNINAELAGLTATTQATAERLAELEKQLAEFGRALRKLRLAIEPSNTATAEQIKPFTEEPSEEPESGESEPLPQLPPADPTNEQAEAAQSSTRPVILFAPRYPPPSRDMNLIIGGLPDVQYLPVAYSGNLNYKSDPEHGEHWPWFNHIRGRLFNGVRKHDPQLLTHVIRNILKLGPDYDGYFCIDAEGKGIDDAINSDYSNPDVAARQVLEHQREYETARLLLPRATIFFYAAGRLNSKSLKPLGKSAALADMTGIACPVLYPNKPDDFYPAAMKYAAQNYDKVIPWVSPRGFSVGTNNVNALRSPEQLRSIFTTAFHPETTAVVYWSYENFWVTRANDPNNRMNPKLRSRVEAIELQRWTLSALVAVRDGNPMPDLPPRLAGRVPTPAETGE